ncbi:MAG TPA: efflux RND transporter periplasmic adaptor subunit [Bryobacteraceae bacterium]|nr:efflux RND transporter periplasmic adaptor subunit [Bryobacteraceae bacterium]
MKIQFLSPILASLLLAACGGEAPTKTAAAPAAPVAVKTVAVATASWANSYEATGTVRARTTAVISAQVMGYVREVNVNAGDRVRAGQPLVTVDARDLEANYLRAEAGLEEARASMPEVENAAAAAKAQLELAQVTHRRMEDLFSKKSISNQEFDESTARLRAARANYEMALSKGHQVKARIAQAEQARSAAGINRGYTRITAPFAGVVTAKSVDPGSLATPGAPLLTIEREGAYRMEAQVEESLLGSIKVGQPVAVALDTLPEPMQSRVSEIVPAVDPGSRAYTVKIDLPPSGQLRSGLFGRALFPRGSRQVLAVPASAVTERGQLSSVMVADGGAAHTRLITTGRRNGADVEVLSGLSAGERLIYPVPPGLQDGARVEVRP